ncbi:MAG: C-20 methyltransferase BchU [Oscillochloris sp.]|nr:C-20 methyltransferase BchU [Oscillochloris sp.]
MAIAEQELLAASRRAYDLVFKSMVETACLKAARDLNLFGLLAAGPLPLDVLATRVEGVPLRLERLLVSLGQIGLVLRTEQGWALTELARHFFVVPANDPSLTMAPFADYMVDQLESYYLRLADVVRGNLDFTGVVPYPPRSRADSLFYETIHRSNVYFPIKLMRKHAHLEGVKHLVDAGGGIGDVAAALCKQFPDLHVSLINLPSAVDLVRENVAAQGLSERIIPVVIDLYRDEYPACDAVLFSRIMYPMSAQLCTMLCQRAFAALEPGGRILICDMIIDDSQHPNYDYLSHYLCAVGTDFSVLDFKPQSAYSGILQAVGFSQISHAAGYDHVLFQAVKPA